MAVVPSISEVKNIVLKTLNWIKLGMVPVGTIQTGLYTAPPAGYLAFKRTDQILKSQYPALCALLFKINGFKGNGSTYANIPNVDHRVIELASNVSEVGQLIEAGLPDIIGSFGAIVPDKHASYRSGAFESATISESSNDAFVVSGQTKRDAIYGYSLRATWSSSVFGKSATNQSNALRLLAIIKI